MKGEEDGWNRKGFRTPLDKLKPADVLNNGFYQIKNLDTGSIASTPISYSAGKIEGVDKVRVDQLQKGQDTENGGVSNP